MLFKTGAIKINDRECVRRAKFTIWPPFDSMEIAPGMRMQSVYEELKAQGLDVRGKIITMAPYYDSDEDKDPRMKNPKIKALVEKTLVEHPEFGKTFGIYDPMAEKRTVTIGELNEKDKIIADLQAQVEKLGIKQGKSDKQTTLV